MDANRAVEFIQKRGGGGKCYLTRHMVHQVDEYLHHWGHRRRREKGAGSFFKDIMAENFPNLEKQTFRDRNPKFKTRRIQKEPHQRHYN